MSNVLGRVGAIAVSDDGGTTYYDIGSTVDGELTASKASVDKTTRDSNGYRERDHGIKEGSVSASCLWDEADTAQAKIVDSFHGNSDLLVRFRVQTGTGFKEANDVAIIVTSSNAAGPLEEMATHEFAFDLSGDFSYSAQP